MEAIYKKMNCLIIKWNGQGEGKKILLEEGLYYAFFSVILFTKGIGLDEGSLLFRGCLCLSMLFLAGKILLGKYSLIEIISMMVLAIWGIITFENTGSLGMFIYILILIGMKNVPVRRVFKVGLVVWSSCIVYTVTMALFFGRTGVRIVHEKFGMGALLRESLGYTHPNVLHITYIMLMVFILYLAKEKDKKLSKTIFGLMLGNGYIFLYSLSITGILFSLFLLTSFIYFRERKKISKIETLIIQAVPCICLGVSTVLPIILEDGIIYKIVNGILNNRLWAIRTYILYYDVSLFGKHGEEITFSLDNSYVFALRNYGAIPLCILIIGYTFLIRYYLKNNRRIELAIICAFLVAGLSEPFLFNASIKNITIVFLGEYIFTFTNRRNKVFSLGAAYNYCFLIKTQFFDKIKSKTATVKWRNVTVVAVLFGMIWSAWIYPQDRIKIDNVYADEKLCHVGGKTVTLHDDNEQERTLYLETIDTKKNYYYFSRENSLLLDVMEIRRKISESLYIMVSGYIVIAVAYVCIKIE